MNCLKIKLFFALLFFTGANFIFADDLTFDSAVDNYVIEYERPVPSAEDPSTLNCLFTKPLSPDIAEDFLMVQTKLALKFQQPAGDLMAYAWLHTNENESMMELPDGSTFLIYSSKLNKILTEKAYSAAIAPKPNPNAGIDVSFEVSLVRSPDGEVKVFGKTNLPDQMELLVSLKDKTSGYTGEDNVSVIKGQFESEDFTNSGASLPAGQYEVSINSGLPGIQPDDVKNVIGKNGENLTGQFVKAGWETTWYSLRSNWS
jgi:hypothetical protein